MVGGMATPQRSRAPGGIVHVPGSPRARSQFRAVRALTNNPTRQMAPTPPRPVPTCACGTRCCCCQWMPRRTRARLTRINQQRLTVAAGASAATASVSLAFGFASKLYAGEPNLIASKLYAHVLNLMNLMTWCERYRAVSAPSNDGRRCDRCECICLASIRFRFKVIRWRIESYRLKVIRPRVECYESYATRAVGAVSRASGSNDGRRCNQSYTPTY